MAAHLGRWGNGGKCAALLLRGALAGALLTSCAAGPDEESQPSIDREREARDQRAYIADMISCLEGLGVPVSASEGGFTVDKPGISVDEERAACETELGEFPWSAPLTDAELERFYELKKQQAECMRDLGADVPQPPSLEVYMETWRSPQPPSAWDPELDGHLYLAQCPSPSPYEGGDR